MKTKLTHIAALLLLLSGLGLSPTASADMAKPNAPNPAGKAVSVAVDNTRPATQVAQPGNDRLAWQRVGSPLRLEA